ncbi:MAG: protein kinase [Myxococcales bacterium]|nr:protein kinase [Myxococcales bacterium]
MSTSQPLLFEHTLVGGKYRLDEVVGMGGVGTVFRATHLWTERECAVKVLNANLPHFDTVRKAFLREARATVQLEHPNVVDVLDMGEDDAGTTYMVMELLEGPTLRDVLLERGSLTTDETASIFWPLMEALETAHELGIVHKDFKPENIILSTGAFGVMIPKLLDFGVAQIFRESQLTVAEDTDRLIVGTPQYMSPEQARNQRQLIGPQTDVWGVAAVWYECLTGRCPFDGDVPLEVLKAVCDAPLVLEGVPDAQARVLRRALERSPSKRTPSLARLREELESAGVSRARGTTSDAPISSRLPDPERPSYVRSTRPEVGSADPKTTGPRSIRLDSELIRLPAASHRRAAIGGLALAVAVAFTAWWTIGGPRDEAAPSSPAKSIPQPSGAQPHSLESPEPESRVVSPASDKVASPSAGKEAVGSPDPSDAAQAPTDRPTLGEGPAASDDSSASAPTRPINPKRRKVQTPPPPTDREEYEKPPDLVTEW